MSNEPPAPPFLLAGLICNEVVWAAELQALAEFRPIAFRGYGDARTLVSMAELALESAPPRISLAGHSMGARVALEMMRLAPARIERLALLDTGVHPVMPDEKEKRMALFEIGVRHGMAALVDAWLPPMVHPDLRQDAAFMKPLRDMCLSFDLARFEDQMIALLERPDPRPVLATIDCPALVGVGSDDAWSPVEQHRQIAAQIKGADLAVFDHAGHMAPYEAPEQVSAALRHWLQRPVDR
jgi:pimeloyl-ACP methyl ester carboxylesterase